MISASFYTTLEGISAVAALFPILAFLIRIASLQAIHKLLFFYFLFCGITDLCMNALDLVHAGFFYIQNLFTVGEGVLLISVFYFIFDTLFAKKVVLILLVLFIITLFYQFVIKRELDQRDHIVIALECVTICGLSIGYFNKLLNELTAENIRSDFFVWINAGFLIYFSMTFFIYGFINLMGTQINKQTMDLLLSIHLLGNIVFQILLTIGAWKIRPK